MVKDTAKSLEHIIMKCDPPTLAMPMMATGATVLGLYSHIAHLVDKEEGDIPQLFKGTKLKQTRGRGKPKGKPQDQRQNPPKFKRWMRLIIMKAPTIITTIPQVSVESTDLIMGRAATDNSEDLYHEIEDKDINIVNVSFRIYCYQRSTLQQNHTQYGSTCKPYFQGNQVNTYRGRGWGRGSSAIQRMWPQ